MQSAKNTLFTLHLDLYFINVFAFIQANVIWYASDLERTVYFSIRKNCLYIRHKSLYNTMKKLPMLMRKIHGINLTGIIAVVAFPHGTKPPSKTVVDLSTRS